MAYVLFENGKKLGDIKDWTLTDRPAVHKVVLGKEIVTPKPKDLVTFTSPKPVKRKNSFTVVQDQKIEFVIQVTNVKDHTLVTGEVLERRNKLSK